MPLIPPIDAYAIDAVCRISLHEWAQSIRLMENDCTVIEHGSFLSLSGATAARKLAKRWMMDLLPSGVTG